MSAIIIDRQSMISDKIYEIGNMLGLENEDIYDVIANKSASDKMNISKTPPSPVDTYGKIILYGTVSIKDFR